MNWAQLISLMCCSYYSTGQGNIINSYEGNRTETFRADIMKTKSTTQKISSVNVLVSERAAKENEGGQRERVTRKFNNNYFEEHRNYSKKQGTLSTKFIDVLQTLGGNHEIKIPDISENLQYNLQNVKYPLKEEIHQTSENRNKIFCFKKISEVIHSKVDHTKPDSNPLLKVNFNDYKSDIVDGISDPRFLDVSNSTNPSGLAEFNISWYNHIVHNNRLPHTKTDRPIIVKKKWNGEFSGLGSKGIVEGTQSGHKTHATSTRSPAIARVYSHRRDLEHSSSAEYSLSDDEYDDETEEEDYEYDKSEMSRESDEYNDYSSD